MTSRPLLSSPGPRLPPFMDPVRPTARPRSATQEQAPKAESNFLQAEAVSRGWGLGSASALFTAGINASFATDGIPDSAASYLLNAPDAQFPAATSAQLQAIITQKYYAMCGSQGFEAWTEWRRTGFPTFFVPSAASSGRPFPLRFLYPQSELTGNLNYPGTVPETTPVWWDVQ